MADLFQQFLHSGLKINLGKSRAFFSARIAHRKKDKISSISSIRATNSLEKYLGFPILMGRVKKEDFYFILDKLHDRLASWKSKLLNKVGRLTLAKSVLNAIPTYYMQVNWFPASICHKIDQITNRFIWKGSSGKGLFLVAWDKVSRPRKEGGLGIRVARDMNTALLGKLVWDMLHNPHKLWVSLLSHKYLRHGSILEVQPHSGSPIWNSIVKARNVLRDGYEYHVGNGESLFWYSSWLTRDPLCNQVFVVHVHDMDTKINDLFYNNQ